MAEGSIVTCISLPRAVACQNTFYSTASLKARTWQRWHALMDDVEMQDMETLVCRQTLAGHKHDVLFLSGLHLSLLPKVDSSATGMGASKLADVGPSPHILVSILL